MIKLGTSKEEVLFNELIEMAQNIEDASSVLSALFLDVFKGDYFSATSKNIKIKSIYERISMNREDIVSTIYREAFLPDFKESMLSLTHSIYYVMKSVKDAGRAMTSRKPSELLCLQLKENFLNYLATINEASKKMKQMISMLSNNIKESLKVGKEIQMLERNGEEIKDSMIQRLYELEKDNEVISILQMKDVITFLDDILDNMEEASLSVEILYSTLKS
ncbi:DUF47 domain-containing protein [Acidianus sp. RZ1]|uniref:DUF47 domain-containing protein n=1 Tax=Acidianus sp. RZ1 TaxID=1540082 RepID=UPI001492FD0E|nr:DUF47 family protein [Acidianus sp. RZ1]NON62656.1 DUF47 family protein [Acidianus sp. RZ1]